MIEKMIKRVLTAGVIAALLLFATACSLQKSLDVIGNDSVAAFGAVLDTVPDQISADEANGGWSLSAPDGTARFIWSGDWSKSPVYDVMLALDAASFLEAGLDPEKLPEHYIYYEDTLLVGTKLGEDALQYNGASAPLAAYEQIVDLSRGSISYHMSLDHYGVALGNGNMFEWAKDLGANDKDIVFVLDPEPLIAAGVDPEAVDGWVFAKVEVHMDGKTTEVDKFLKPFDLT